MASCSIFFGVTGLGSVGNPRSQKLRVRYALDTNVSDMSINETTEIVVLVHYYELLDAILAAPKGLFPPEPEKYRGPKLKVVIIGAGLSGMSTAVVEPLHQGHEVDIYESRSFIGGKVGSFVDKRGNHIEMGLHVFFG